MSQRDETAILEGIAKGNTQIIKAFYERNQSVIQQYVLQNSGQLADVEDIFQDALVFLYQKLQSGDLEISCSIHTYFYAVCKNMWRNRLRKKHKIVSQDTFLETEDVLTPTILDSLQQNERETLYQAYFLKLDAKCRELLALVFDGKSMREISEQTTYSEGYARKKKFDCKKALIVLLENDQSYQELRNTTSI